MSECAWWDLMKNMGVSYVRPASKLNYHIYLHTIYREGGEYRKAGIS